jgi:hypothetical protein
MSDYSMLTPFLVPPALRPAKAVNIGDGFIAHSIADLLRPHVCRVTLTTREPLSDEAIEQINSTRLLVLAGANQLTDHFTITPNMDLDGMRRIRVPIVPVGIGIHGVAAYNRSMSRETRAMLLAIHERIRFSSWRCPQTVEYLRRHCPAIADKALMTCCPVAYREPLLSGAPFSDETRRVVVTVTERGDFWERERRTIDFVARKFRRAEKVLSLHQVFPSSRPERGWRAAWNTWRGHSGTPHDLHRYAERRGFTVYRPENVDKCWKFYESCDLHLGSRLHSHLFFLSKAKRSYLSYVDERCVGISQALDFPLCEPTAWERSLAYDFEQCRAGARRCQKTMDHFVTYLQELLA